VFDTMYFSMEGDPYYPPPGDRTYNLRLLAVPDGIVGAPPAGTTWEVPPQGPFNIELPTFRTKNGLQGYRFSFMIGPATPEPGALVLLALGAILSWARRHSARLTT
jgi:MYXO-CTERM domain-containing protein